VRRFWLPIREGETYADAAAAVGYEMSAGKNWFRKAGGVTPAFVTSPARGRYLSVEERVEILVGLKLRLSIRAIARGLDRAPSTVLRELRRNMSVPYRSRAVRRRSRLTRAAQWGYCPFTSQRRAENRTSAAARTRLTKIAENPRLRARIDELLREDYSPEQIAAQLRLEHPDDPELQVSHETIYKALYVQGRGELRRDLHRRLRTGRATRKPRRRTGQRRGRIAGMVNISERPADVADRAVPGHWEGDLIMGSKESNSAIGTLVERSSRFVVLLHLPHGYGADAVQAAMVEAMSRLPSTLRRTLTWDQGKEMTNHIQIAAATGLDIYFCDPASPWQRGTNENTNGLLRQYFPKGTDLSSHDAGYLDYVALKLNTRPRKTLDWSTPAAVLDRILCEPNDQPGVASLP
jgi:IS30 family transposase